ncbi:MAG: cation diffusion facilitator family transporter [Candidatus Kapaibacteriota bacterium]
MNTSHQPSKAESRAMNISLLIGFLMLALKWTAYMLTGSIAIFSDAMETIVHIAAVGFAWYSLRITYLPADEDHHFGHDKITFFSAGLEGALIILAAIIIIQTAIEKLIQGVTLEQIGYGTALTATAAVINTLLGIYLVKTGKNNSSLIIEANGRHILTDAWTSAGAIAGLLLAYLTGAFWIDPLMALFFGANIIFEGGKLIRRSIQGLMDKTDPELFNSTQKILNEKCKALGITYHRLRLRMSGNIVYIDFHLQFPDDTSIESAHLQATDIEHLIQQSISHPCDIVTHLESTSHHPPDHI